MVRHQTVGPESHQWCTPFRSQYFGQGRTLTIAAKITEGYAFLTVCYIKQHEKALVVGSFLKNSPFINAAIITMVPLAFCKGLTIHPRSIWARSDLDHAYTQYLPDPENEEAPGGGVFHPASISYFLPFRNPPENGSVGAFAEGLFRQGYKGQSGRKVSDFELI